jgi:protein-tyrosine phosphatase
MFNIFARKEKAPPNFSELSCDMHSHLLPGIDDGSPDVDTSIELITGLTDLGYTKFITTPHILWDMYKNTKETIAPAHKTVVDELKVMKNPTPIDFAAEYFLDDHVDELIENNIPLLTIRHNWVLVEISFVSAPLDLKEKLFALTMAGYQPILAHPERYPYFYTDRHAFEEMKESGYYFQVNMLSLAGYYGKQTMELAQYLLKKQYIDFLGTDLHHPRHIAALRKAPQLTDTVKQLLDTGKLLNPTL